MADGRTREAWCRHSYLLAFIHNSGFGAQRALSPEECNPYSQTAAARDVADKVDRDIALARLRGAIPKDQTWRPQPAESGQVEPTSS